MKFALVLGTVALAAAVSRLVGANRRSTSAEPDHHIPDRLDITHFAQASGRWLIVVFSSATCETCRGVVADVDQMARADLFTAAVELEHDPDLHRHYQIDAVPTTLIADPTGYIRKSFLGPVGCTALEGALAHAISTHESGNV